MYAKPYDRKFGVEFEFNIPGLVPELDSNGYSSKHVALRNLLNKNGFKNWHAHGDGSEFEVKTPVLSGPNGFKTVKRFLSMIEDVGGRVHPRYDGLHVHHDAPEFMFNKDLIVRLVETWIENQSEIMKMVSSYRSRTGACPSWNSIVLAELKNAPNWRESYYGRRNLNIQALSRHGTIELRAHEGTLDYESVFSWVRFGQAFIGSIVSGSGDIISSSPRDLARKVNLSRNASRFMATKIRENYGRVWA